MLATAAIWAQEICRSGGAIPSVVKRGKAEKWAARSERLAASLRENLKRRKAQARGRTAARTPDEGLRPAEAERETPKPDFRRNPNGN